MKNILFKLLLMLSIFNIGNVAAQSFYLLKKTGFETSFQLNDTRSIRFANGNLDVNLLNGTISSHLVNDIQRISFSPSTGVDNPSTKKIVDIFPIPADDKFYLRFDNSVLPSRLQITAKSIDGKIIFSDSQFSPVELITIDASRWKSGIYLLFVNDGKNTYIEKLIKK